MHSQISESSRKNRLSYSHLCMWTSICECTQTQGVSDLAMMIFKSLRNNEEDEEGDSMTFFSFLA